MIDWQDPSTWLAAIGTAGAAFFGVKKLRRKDQIEDSNADAVVSLNGAAREIVEELRASLKRAIGQIDDLTKEVHALKDRVEVWMKAHTECQQENRRLMLENATLKKMVPHDEQDPIGGMTP